MLETMLPHAPDAGVRATDRPAHAPRRLDEQSAVETRRDFAVLVPALDEVANIDRLFDAIRDAFERHGLDGEVVLVDDGSTDGTYEAAWRALRRCGLRGDVIRHPANRGKTQALLTAAAATDAELLIFFDADLQYSPDEFPSFLVRLDEGWDVVAGRKVGQYGKATVSSIYNRLSGRLFDVPAHDLNAMKAMRRRVLNAITLRHDWHRFLVVLAHAKGFSVTEIDVALHPRRAGSSKYESRWRILVGAGDLLVVWFYLRFSTKPIQLFGGAGLVLGATGVALGLTAIVLRFLEVPPPPFGYRPVLGLVALLTLVGVTLVGFGLVAEMITILRGEVEALRRERPGTAARLDAGQHPEHLGRAGRR